MIDAAEKNKLQFIGRIKQFMQQALPPGDRERYF